MTLLANIFSFSTIFSRMFSRTHKLRYLRAISKKEKTSKPLRFQGFLCHVLAEKILDFSLPARKGMFAKEAIARFSLLFNSSAG